MADTGQRLINPDERILYQEGRSWLPASWVHMVAVLALIAGIFMLVMVLADKSATIFACLIVPVAVWAGAGVKQSASECWITDRRILLSAGRFRPTVTDVPLGDIGAVEFKATGFPGVVTITRKNGTVEPLNNLRHPQQFAKALAEAAGVPVPALIGRLANMGPYLCILGGFPMGILCAWFAYRLIFGNGPLSSADPGLVHAFWFVPLFLALWGAVFIGVYLAAFVGIVLLRPFVTAEEMRNGICLESDTKAGRAMERLTRPILLPLFLKWASLLYGKPILRCDEATDQTRAEEARISDLAQPAGGVQAGS